MNIHAVNKGRELLAFISTLLEKHPEIFRRFYRPRAIIEGLFSSSKRKNGRIKLRVRRSDLERLMVYAEGAKVPLPERDRNGNPISAKAVKLYEDLTVMTPIERVGEARRNEAYLKAIASNLRALVRLERRHGDKIESFDIDMSFTPIPRWTPPRAA